MSRGVALEAVASAPDRFHAAFDVESLTRAVAETAWNPAQYLWHVVDVIRYGTERLLALDLDAANGAMAWDADEAMHLRRRSPMSIVVGLAALELAVRQWAVVAESVSDEKQIRHPEFGMMDALLMCRRNAHEVVHHEWDVRRYSTRLRSQVCLAAVRASPSKARTQRAAGVRQSEQSTSRDRFTYYPALVAQGIEHRFPKPCVASSNLAEGTSRLTPSVRRFQPQVWHGGVSMETPAHAVPCE